MRAKFKTTFNKNIALFIWLGHIAIAVYFYTRGPQYDAYYWGAAFILVASLPYLNARVKNRFMPYEAAYLYLAGFIVNYTSNMFLAKPILPHMDKDLWTYVMKLVLGGAIAFLAGYWFGWGKAFAAKLPLRNFLITKEKLLRLPVKLYLLGSILHVIFTTSFINPELSRFQGWRIIGILMRNSILTALMIDVYFYFSPQDPELRIKNKKKYLFRPLIFLSAEIFYSFLSGMRENIFIPVVLIFVAYMKAAKRMPYLAMLIFAVFFIIFIMPFMTAFRSQYWHGVDFNESSRYAFEQLSQRERIERVEVSTARISNSVQMAVYCAGKRIREEQVGTYKDWTDYLLRFVPRFIWPSKPIVDYNKIGKELGIVGEEDDTTSVNLTLLAAFILNYDTLSLIIGMFLIGVIVRTYWEWLIIRAQENMIPFIIYFNLLYVWMRDEEFYVILHSNLSFLFYTYILLKFINKGKGRSTYVRDLRDNRL